jgi:hypothetical protein
MVAAAEILTPRARGDITRSLAKTGKWKGSRRGFRFVFARLTLLGMPRIAWAVYHQKELVATGEADTIFEAADLIGALVGRRQLADDRAKGRPC